MTSDTPAGRRFRVFRRRWSAPSRARRRLGAAVRMIAALALAGGVYTAFTPNASAEDDRTLSQAAQEGKALFHNTCISCHGFGGAGGALSSGKYAPSLHDATAREIYGAMLTGPQNMPVFGDNELS